MAQVYLEYRALYGTSNNALQAKSSEGTLHNITFGTTVTGGVYLSDGTSGTTSTIAQFLAGAPAATYTFDSNFTNGLRVTPSGTNVFTITFL